MTVTTIRVGMLGCGSVGGALGSLLATRGPELEERTGIRFEIGPIAVRDLQKPRPATLDGASFVDDPAAVVTDPSVDIVVELIGGIEPAKSLVLAALAAGKPVITGNKALLASHGSEMFAAADAAGVDLLFEASVAGGIPFIRPLRESLAGEQIFRVMGILNGTTNYILTKMGEEGAAYDDVLAEAQALGYAEADPAADVEGYDAAAKAAIIGSIAYGRRIVLDDVYVEGITDVTEADMALAGKLDMVIKLLAIIEAYPEGITVRVHPTLVPNNHPLASVRESFNAVFVEGAAVGDLMFYGRGAGGEPTASAVLGDLIDAAQNLRKGTHASVFASDPAPLLSVDELTSEYLLDLTVSDRPGVLATVTGCLGEGNVSIRSMEQIDLGGEARLQFITHRARERDMRATLDVLKGLDIVESINGLIRILGA